LAHDTGSGAAHARTVILLPGFGTSPRSMVVMESFLRRAGHRVRDWASAATPASAKQFRTDSSRCRVLHRTHREPVVLGRLEPRRDSSPRVAREHPHHVRQRHHARQPGDRRPPLHRTARCTGPRDSNLDELELAWRPLLDPSSRSRSPPSTRARRRVAWRACIDRWSPNVSPHRKSRDSPRPGVLTQCARPHRDELERLSRAASSPADAAVRWSPGCGPAPRRRHLLDFRWPPNPSSPGPTSSPSSRPGTPSRLAARLSRDRAQGRAAAVPGRTLEPDAERVRCAGRTGRPPSELLRIHAAGLFEGRVPFRRPLHPYRLRVTTADGPRPRQYGPYYFDPKLDFDLYLFGEANHYSIQLQARAHPVTLRRARRHAPSRCGPRRRGASASVGPFNLLDGRRHACRRAGVASGSC